MGADVVKMSMELRRPRPVAGSRFHPEIMEKLRYVAEYPMTAIANLAPRAVTNHFRDDRIEFTRWGFKLTGAAVGEGDIDMACAYRIFRETSTMDRINIETEMAIPLDDRETALRMELDAVRRSIRYCCDALEIGKAS